MWKKERNRDIKKVQKKDRVEYYVVNDLFLSKFTPIRDPMKLGRRKDPTRMKLK